MNKFRRFCWQVGRSIDCHRRLQGAGLLIPEWQGRYRSNFLLRSRFSGKGIHACFQHANALIVSGLSGCESIRGQEVEFLVRTTAGQKETDTARIFQDHGTDLEQL